MIWVCLAIAASTLGTARFEASESETVGVHITNSILNDFSENRPNQAFLKSNIPFKSGAFAIVNITCKSVGADHKLAGCREDAVYPDHAGYEGIGQKLLTAFAFDPRYADSSYDRFRNIKLQLRIWNSDRVQLVGPCIEPVCFTEPPKQQLPPPPVMY